MGEFERVRVVPVRRALVRSLRVFGVAVAVVGSVALLTSCAQLGVKPAPQATATGAVVDPSVPSATPTTVPTPTASAAPVEEAPAAPATTAPAATLTKVVPFITTADWDAKAKALDVSAIVPNVREGDGTCTVTLTQGGTVRTATSAGVAASTYTGCQAVAVTSLATGTWQVRVAYASATAAGASAVRTVQVG